MAKHQQDGAQIAATIRAFLNGSAAGWDWDDFTSCSLFDARLDSIRVRAARVNLPIDCQGRETLERLAQEAERLAE
ncbi:MAG TPA: hypothetical protein VF552_10705 [Allosphingosinicella sp.]|jgi:hypothetical protein